MKFKKIKPAHIGLIVIVMLMLGMVIAPNIMQSFWYSGESTKLPESNIINYELNSNQENILIRNGMTILKFYHNSTCANCPEQESFLENLMGSTDFGNQLFLEKILSTDKKLPKLTIISYYGGETLVNATDDEILDTLCELLISPPLECTLRNV